MDATVILILLIASAVIAVILIAVFRKKPVSKQEQAASDYTDGLNLLLAGDRDGALKKFREAVTKNSRNVDAYLKIGDILRQQGQVERAINVHKYLTVRRGLTVKQHLEILRSLVLDYQKAKEYDKALAVLDKIVEEHKGLAWAQEMKLQIYEEQEEWEKAFQTCKELGKSKPEYSNGRLALYKVQEGLQHADDGKTKDAQSRFKDAIKIDPQSPPAYIYLADLYRKDDRKGDALKVLKEFVERVPSHSFLAIDRIKQLLYEGGVYGEIENVYYEIIKNQPNNLTARIALAENFEKKGDVEKAIATCREVLEQEPDHKGAKKCLVRLYHKSGDKEEALTLALDLLESAYDGRENFSCRECSYESDQPFWRCPECHEWQTAAKRNQK